MARSSREGLSIGIDLGTTYSCVGVQRNDKVEIIINDQGKRTTPSCVAFTESEHYVGNAATNQASKNPLNTIYGAKRLIGRRFNDECVQSYMKQCSFRIVSGQNGSPIMVVNYKSKEKRLTPEEVSAMVLSKMRSISESFLAKPIKGAVVTVPAYFNDSQRSSTKLAAEISGLKVLGIINEPTAAAIAYGFHRMVGNDNTHKNVLVFDLGGGTLDVSIVVIRKGVLEVKATCGDTYLGGEDFDTNMVDHFVKEFQMKHKKDITGNPRALRRLRTACESAKRILSSCHDTEVVVEAIFSGIDFNSTIRRAKFEQLNMALFKKCMEPVEKCLVDAHMRKSDIDDVVMVGGSSRIPRIQELLSEFLNNKKLCFTINPDEAIAHGAAIHASNLLNGTNDYVLNGTIDYVLNGANNHVQNYVLLDVIPLSIGIETCGTQMTVVIPRNTPIPVRKNHTVTTYYDNQTKAGIRVYEGERELTIDNYFLGEFELTGIPKAKAGVPEIVLTFDIDKDGIVTVSAVETSVMRRKEITISSNRGRLSKEDVERMVREAEQYREENEKRRRRVEARSGLESVLFDVKDKFNDQSFASRISSSNTRRIRNAIDQAEEFLEGVGDDGDWNRLESLNLVLSSIWRDIKDDM